MDDGSSKNAHLIDLVEKKLTNLESIREYFNENHNNRESALVVTKLQEAEHWIRELVEVLK